MYMLMPKLNKRNTKINCNGYSYRFNNNVHIYMMKICTLHTKLQYVTQLLTLFWRAVFFVLNLLRLQILCAAQILVSIKKGQHQQYMLTYKDSCIAISTAIDTHLNEFIKCFQLKHKQKIENPAPISMYAQKIIVNFFIHLQMILLTAPHAQ